MPWCWIKSPTEIVSERRIRNRRGKTRTDPWKEMPIFRGQAEQKQSNT